MASPEGNNFKRYILPVALGIGALVGGKQPETVPDTPVTPVAQKEKVPQKPISFEALKDIFRVEIQIPGENVVIHIDQRHNDSRSLARTERGPGGIDKIIESQKAVERAIRLLMEQRGMREFFVETVTPANEKLFNGISQQIQSFKNSIEAKDVKTLLDAIDFMEKTRESFKTDETKHDLDRGLYSYFLLKQVREILTAASRGHLPLQDSAFAHLNQLQSDLEQDPNIRGDRIYVWGAPFKMMIDGEITLLAAEDPQLNDQLLRLYAAIDATDPNDRERLASLRSQVLRVQNLREDAIIDFIKKYLEQHPEQKEVVVILGGGHYLVGNLKNGLGHIKLSNIADDEFTKKLKKDPRYYIADLRDEADIKVLERKNNMPSEEQPKEQR